MVSDQSTAALNLDPLLRAILESCEHGLCVLDGDGLVLASNSAAHALLHRTHAELKGQALLSTLLQASGWPREATDPPAFGQARWNSGQEQTELVCWRLERPGPESFRPQLLHLETPHPASPTTASHDLASNFQAIVDTITDGVMVIDDQGTIEILNPAAERMFGYSRQESIGQNVRMLMPSPEREHHDEYLANYQRTHQRKIIGIGREVTGRRKDGRLFPLYLSIGELLQGQRRLYVGVTHDLTARKAAEERLTILSRAVDQSPVGVLVTDLEGRVEYVNKGFSRLTGFQPDEVIGRVPQYLRAEKTGETLHEIIQNQFRSGEEWHGEVRDVRKSGRVYWALQTITPVRDASGRVSRYLAMQQDITQQKLDRESLQLSEERFRHIADMVGEWLWEQDAEGRYLYSSAAAEQILGYRPEEIIGRSYQDFLTEADRHWIGSLPPPDQVTQDFRKLINHYRHKDGHEVFTESTGAPIVDAQGKVQKWRGMDLDITARKQFEDALRVRDRAIEAANVGIAIADAREPHFPLVYANPALCRITGYARDELMEKSLRILQGPDTAPADRDKIRSALKEGGPCEVVIRNYRKDGTPFWNELLLSPVRDQDGVLTHYIGIQTDVTQRRRAEKQRRELEIARQIQQSLLPKAPLTLAEIEIAGLCLPASNVGGDYYDFIHHGDHVDLVIADVSGHSVGAALIMAEMRSTLKAEMRRNRLVPPPTSEILTVLNEVLFDDLSASELFITMFYLRYQPASRRLHYANAGHNPPLLLRRGERGTEPLDAEGLILGVRPRVRFEEQSLEIRPGDSLLLYTDGVTEAQNETGEFFGFQRLSRNLHTHRELPPERLLLALQEDLQRFRGRREADDDISLVAVRFG